MSIANQFYTIFLRRNSTYWLTAMFGAFVFERVMDVGCDTYWENRNKGKLWKDIKDNYGG